MTSHPFALRLALSLLGALPALAPLHAQEAAGAAPAAIAAAPAPLALGDLTLSGPFSRATLPNAPVAAGFLRIENRGTEDDRLLSATSEAAGETQIHEMVMVEDVMRMRPLADGLVIPAGGAVDLSPGGFHLMFMDLREPFVEGRTVDVTLTFERAGSIDVPLAVGAPDAEMAEAPGASLSGEGQ